MDASRVPLPDNFLAYGYHWQCYLPLLVRLRYPRELVRDYSLVGYHLPSFVWVFFAFTKQILCSLPGLFSHIPSSITPLNTTDSPRSHTHSDRGEVTAANRSAEAHSLRLLYFGLHIFHVLCPLLYPPPRVGGESQFT